VSLALYADVKKCSNIQSASTTLLQERHVADDLADRKHLAQPSRIVHSANREPIPFHVVNTCIFYTSSLPGNPPPHCVSITWWREVASCHRNLAGQRGSKFPLPHPQRYSAPWGASESFCQLSNFVPDAYSLFVCMFVNSYSGTTDYDVPYYERYQRLQS
jgi:hypothetical protein